MRLPFAEVEAVSWTEDDLVVRRWKWWESWFSFVCLVGNAVWFGFSRRSCWMAGIASAFTGNRKPVSPIAVSIVAFTFDCGVDFHSFGGLGVFRVCVDQGGFDGVHFGLAKDYLSTDISRLQRATSRRRCDRSRSDGALVQWRDPAHGATRPDAVQQTRLRYVTGKADALLSFDVTALEYGVDVAGEEEGKESLGTYRQLLPKVLRSIFLPMVSSLMCSNFVLFPITERASQVGPVETIAACLFS
ncbi:hypothetical protein HPB49_024992 [Dermacentor silvarum]|uniref:Uncharacterized protein n=1 Tax=Dermacentor silvarum TaxID=543639 RepID=A0ACB8DHC1_DERSI|nr:hypothetical protein HPB49_024992 [Dermacentor silvarum]